MSEENPEHLRYKIEDSHEEIWLEPQCAEHSYEGRTWAHNCAWDEKCGECGSPPVKYRRADLCLSDPRVKALVEAAREAKVLIGATNDFLKPHIVEVNINQAWHKLNTALAAMEE